MYVLDDKDRALLAELQRDSRQTVQQLAAAVGLSATPCWKRVKDMEAAGVIRGYGATVDRESVGLALCVLAEVNLTQHTENTVREFERAVAACPQIVSCHSTTGAADYSIMVLVEDIKSYEAFLHDTAFKLPGVTHIRSSVVLKEVKAAAGVPIAVARARRGRRARRASGLDEPEDELVPLESVVCRGTVSGAGATRARRCGRAGRGRARRPPC
jgi:DNA-binding Lrp family transcriptional regulator